MRRLSLNLSEPAKKSGQKDPKNRCRTTIPERMVETLAELPFIGDPVVCLSHDQAAAAGLPAGPRGRSPPRRPAQGRNVRGVSAARLTDNACRPPTRCLMAAPRRRRRHRAQGRTAEWLALHKGPGAGRRQGWGQLGGERGSVPANAPRSTDLTLV